MKILSITAQKPHSTGSGTYLTELVNSFDKAGHKQAVVAGIYADDSVNFPNGVKFHPVYFNSEISYPIVGMSDSMPYESTKYSDLDDTMITEFEKVFTKKISIAISDFDPDIIICHHLFLLTAIVRKNFQNKKIYGICHGSDLRQMKNCKTLADIVKPEIRKLNKVCALHKEQAREISQLYDIPQNCVDVIGSGYNSNVFNDKNRTNNKDDKISICFAGKISAAKGVNELLQAFDELTSDEEFKDIQLSMAGGCQEAGLLKKLNELPDNVKYYGQLSQGDLANLFRQSDIFILPSFYEGLGLVVIEAMASGCIPICTDLPGIKNWIDSHVKNSNVRYIPMPEMQGVDVPTETGSAKFVCDIKELIRQTVYDIKTGNIQKNIPDTSNLSWDTVASQILNK